MKKAIREIMLGLVASCGISMLIVSCSTNMRASEADTYLSKEIQMYCEEIGNEYEVCPELLMAMIETESSGKVNAKNGNCIGLMQINTKFHKVRAEHLKAYDIWDARNNILIGTDYLMELAEEYGDLPVVLAVYNGDSSALEDGYVSEYAAKIMERSRQLERLHKK